MSFNTYIVLEGQGPNINIYYGNQTGFISACISSNYKSIQGLGMLYAKHKHTHINWKQGTYIDIISE